jgi:hypothetical protein
MLTCQLLLKACRGKIQPVLHEFQCESCVAFRDEAEAQSRGSGNRHFARAKEKYNNQHERSDQAQLPRNEGNNQRKGTIKEEAGKVNVMVESDNGQLLLGLRLGVFAFSHLP